jgi:putative ABC transport system substrate-binding protein
LALSRVAHSASSARCWKRGGCWSDAYAIYVSKEYIDAGGLIAYGPHYPDLYRRAAIYVDKILRFASPSSLPVEQPTKFELIINLKAASAIGLHVPMALMVRADEVIE